MTSRMLKILAVLAVTTLGTGCKLAVIVPSGGDVTSLSTTRNCAGGSLCEFNITDTTFNESFTATAKPGYVFFKWSAGPGFLCANSVNPTCVIDNTGLPQGNDGIDAVIAGGSFFYAMPLFDFVGIDTDGDGVKDHLDADDDNDGVLDVDDLCPLTGPNLDGSGCPFSQDPDIVFANGRAWYQPNLFVNLSWNQINAACPGGPCIAGVILKGRDMTGWTWAAGADVAGLYNSYGVNPPLPNSIYFGIHEINSAWAPAFFVQFNPTWRINDRLITNVVVSDFRTIDTSHYIQLADYFSTDAVDRIERRDYTTTDSSSEMGAYFFRSIP